MSTPSPSRPPLLLKQLHAVIDKRTTMVCLDAAGQIQPVDEPFETLMGKRDMPPFHLHCRDVVVPWLPGFVSEQRKEANAEIKRRPLKQRRKGPDGYAGRLPPLPDEGPQLPFLHPDDPRGYSLHQAAVVTSQALSRPATVDEVRDSPEMAALLADESAFQSATMGGGEDRILKEIYRQKQMDGLPSVVPDAEVEALLRAGSVGLYRAVRGRDRAQQFLDGEYYAGAGVYGNGTYCLAVHNGAIPESAAMNQLAMFGDSFLRMTLKPEARTVVFDELKARQVEAVALAQAAADAASSAEKVRLQNWVRVLSDAGRFAALLGYDAWFQFPPEYGSSEMIVWNRSMVIVSEVIR